MTDCAACEENKGASAFRTLVAEASNSECVAIATACLARLTEKDIDNLSNVLSKDRFLELSEAWNRLATAERIRSHK